MTRQGAVESSPFRKEIEDMITEGKEDKYISKWLKDNEAYISRQTIGTYRRERYNIPEEASKEYNDKKSKERKKKAVKKQLTDLEKIDQFIENVDPTIIQELDPKDQVKAIPQLFNAKYKMLGMDKPEINVEVKVAKVDAEEQRIIEETADNLARQTEDTESSKSE